MLPSSIDFQGRPEYSHHRLVGTQTLKTDLTNDNTPLRGSDRVDRTMHLSVHAGMQGRAQLVRCHLSRDAPCDGRYSKGLFSASNALLCALERPLTAPCRPHLPTLGNGCVFLDAAAFSIPSRHH